MKSFILNLFKSKSKTKFKTNSNTKKQHMKTLEEIKIDDLTLAEKLEENKTRTDFQRYNNTIPKLITVGKRFKQQLRGQLTDLDHAFYRMDEATGEYITLTAFYNADSNFKTPLTWVEAGIIELGTGDFKNFAKWLVGEMTEEVAMNLYLTKRRKGAVTKITKKYKAELARVNALEASETPETPEVVVDQETIETIENASQNIGDVPFPTSNDTVNVNSEWPVYSVPEENQTEIERIMLKRTDMIFAYLHKMNGDVFNDNFPSQNSQEPQD